MGWWSWVFLVFYSSPSSYAGATIRPSMSLYCIICYFQILCPWFDLSRSLKFIFSPKSWSHKTPFNVKTQLDTMNFFYLTPDLFWHQNRTLRGNLQVSCYWKFVLGILGRLNAELEKKLLISFWEKHCFMWKMAILPL